MFNTQTLGSSGGTLAISAGLTKTGTGTLTLNNASTYTGVSNITNGTLLVSGTPLNIGSSNSTVNVSGNLSYNGDFTFSGASNLSSGTGTVTIRSNSGSVILNGINTFTSPTRISSGTLVLNGGTLSNTGSFNINSGFNLQGNGTLTIPSNLVTTQYFPTQSSKPAGYQQTLGHYVQIGSLTTTPTTLPAAAVFGPTRPGSVTLSGGSLASALGINTSGLVKVSTGTLTLNGSPILLTSGTLLSSGTYNLITAGTLANPGTYNIDSGAASGILTLAPAQISTVPEPSTLVLAGLAMVGGAAIRFRRRQSPSATV
jgi:fibronectin-binding autotransporter adhesin